MMKRFFAILAAGLGLLACTKETPVAETATQPLKFNITVNRADSPDTKAVKTGWEDGDVVCVFFSEAEAPKYLEMKYDAETESWTNTQKNGTEEETFDLTEGTMTAVFLPFGSDAEVGADDDGNFVFNKMYYSYFLKAEQQDYTVEDGVVYGKLNMLLPDGFVQFFVDVSEATIGMAGSYYLWEGHVAPAGVESVAADGTVNMKVRQDGGAMPAYAYVNGTAQGLHFSGILNESARGAATDYAFHISVQGMISKVARGTKTLYTKTSRALKLPGSESDVWEDDPHPAVDLGLDVKWAALNVGAAIGGKLTGDFFAWGETVPYYESIADDGAITWKTGMSDGYLWSTYFDTKDGGTTFTNYATDKKTVLDPANDAATANWGEPWRMPTDEEWMALCNRDVFDWAWDETVQGYIVTSNIPGYEGAFISLPAAGFMSGLELINVGISGFYWSSSLSEAQSDFAKYAYFNPEEMGRTSHFRYFGYPVRPVCD